MRKTETLAVLFAAALAVSATGPAHAQQQQAGGGVGGGGGGAPTWVLFIPFCAGGGTVADAIVTNALQRRELYTREMQLAVGTCGGSAVVRVFVYSSLIAQGHPPAELTDQDVWALVHRWQRSFYP